VQRLIRRDRASRPSTYYSGCCGVREKSLMSKPEEVVACGRPQSKMTPLLQRTDQHNQNLEVRAAPAALLPPFR
jgi:hypothetical protein